METSSVAQARLAFGLFEADLSKEELYRSGRKVALQEKPFRILALLLQRPGEVVTREEVRRELWPEGTFVDFDEGLDTAVKKLRSALKDSAQNPVFIETIPRRGYRFIAPVSNGVPRVHDRSTVNSLSATFTSPKKLKVGGTYFAWALGFVVLVVLFLAIYPRRLRRELDLGRIPMTQLTYNGQVQGVAITPDARNVAYARGDDTHQSLWLQDIATHEEVQILPVGPGFHGLTISPDGSSIYFVRADDNDPQFKYLYSMPLRGGPVRKLTTDVDSPVSFSPDGKQFVYEHCAQPRDDIDVRIANADGSQDHILTVLHGASGMLYQPGPNWSPNTRFIALPALMLDRGLRWVLDVISVPDGGVRELYSTEQDLGRPAWLPDGKSLVFPQLDKVTRRSQLWTISFPQAHAQRLTHDLSDYGPDLDASRDGRSFVTTAGAISSHLWIASAPVLSRLVQASSDNPPFVAVTEAPDGQLLAISQDLTAWMMHTDGSYRIRFSDFQPVDDITSCGSFVVVRAIQNDSIALVRLDKNGTHPLTLVRGDVASPACSADKNYIFYFTWDQPQKIWQVPLMGGTPQYLMENPGDQFSSRLVCSPNGRFLAYVHTSFGRVPSSGLQLAVVRIGHGPPMKQFSFPAEVYATLRWSPSGKGLQYVVTQNGASNLWEQPVSGVKPRQITNFVDSEIFDFNWTADGSKLLLLRGKVSREAILLSQVQLESR